MALQRHARKSAHHLFVIDDENTRRPAFLSLDWLGVYRNLEYPELVIGSQAD